MLPTSDSPQAPPEALTGAVRALVRAARVLEQACEGLSLAHYRVLAAVEAGDQRASRVADRLAVGKPAISAAVDALCTHGLLTRSEAPGDQRAVTLGLTEDGRRLLRSAEAAMARRLEALSSAAPGGASAIPALLTLGEAVEAWREGRR